MNNDTIYAVSSGRPPAAIAVMRVSGPRAGDALVELAGALPIARMATLRTLRGDAGDLLDRGIVLWFPGPESATGEDVAEFHLHGGIAVIAAVSRALAAIGLRHAEPGEFTRRAVFGGRLDLNEAEGLADLLAAETETQRREAVLRATGMLGRELDEWTARLLELSAEVERAIDYDEGEVETRVDIAAPLAKLRDNIVAALARPAAERLRDGIRVAIVGPVNAGKSSLFNALIGADAAIVTDVPGTTRDLIERPVVIDGLPFVLVDTAGRRETNDPIERIGIERARNADEAADLILDLSPEARSQGRRIAVSAKSDLGSVVSEGHRVSAMSGEGVAALGRILHDRAAALLPADGEVSLTARHRDGLTEIVGALAAAMPASDPTILAEHLATARRRIDRLTGRAAVDDLLDTLFARFCLGK